MAYEGIAQGSSEWKIIRKGKVTGSQVTNVLKSGRGGEESEGRKKYKIRLANERVMTDEQFLRMPPDKYVSAEMRWGTEMEPMARMMYEITHGVFVDQVAFVDHPFIPMCGFSPDGLPPNGLIEIKCPMTETHGSYIFDAETNPDEKQGIIPVDYRRQCYLGLSTIRSANWVDWNTYDPRVADNIQLYTIRIERDAKVEKIIKDMEEQIWKFGEEVEKAAEILRNVKPADASRYM